MSHRWAIRGSVAAEVAFSGGGAWAPWRAAVAGGLVWPFVAGLVLIVGGTGLAVRIHAQARQLTESLGAE